MFAPDRVDRAVEARSGDALRVMIVLGFSTVTVVRSGGASPSSSSGAFQPVAVGLPLGRLKRVGVLFSGAPRPWRASGLGTGKL